MTANPNEIECPSCNTFRSGDPLIRYETDGEVYLCLICGCGYKVRRDGGVEEATI